MNYGDYLVLYTIDDPRETVWVINFRRGERKSQLSDLPTSMPGD